MSNSTEITAPIPFDENMVVLAKDPREMRASQEQLVSWFTGRVALAKEELSDAETNLKQAKERKWATRGWARQVGLAKGRLVFYEKCHAALKEGYCIVPDFPVQVFAARTTKSKPKKNTRTTTNSWDTGVPDQQTNRPPLGEGKYVSPQADEKIRNREIKKADGSSTTQFTMSAESFRTPDFPMKRVKPQILDATGKAMALNIFDEIGVLPASRTQHGRDPIVVGRVVRRDSQYQEVALSFLIAWWIDTRDL